MVRRTTTRSKHSKQHQQQRNKLAHTEFTTKVILPRRRAVQGPITIITEKFVPLSKKALRKLALPKNDDALQDADFPNINFYNEELSEADDDDDPDVKPQEYMMYMNDQNERLRKTTYPVGTDVLHKIDKVDPSLVTSFRADALFKQLNNKTMCRCTKRGVRMIIDASSMDLESHGNQIETEGVQQAKARKKGIDPFRSSCPTSMVSRAIRKLGDPTVSHLFGTRNKNSYFREYRSTAGAFFVVKSNQLLRVIIDGRLANTHFKSAEGKFSLFTIETVRQVIDNLSVLPGSPKIDATWYALNFDLRHWFHQLPLPDRLRQFFGIEMTDRDNRDKEQKYFMHPRMVPMGFTLAPFIAQCCTYSMLLVEENGDNFTNSGLGAQADILRGTNMEDQGPPTWIPLKGGGGIFVLLDNILIVTHDKDVADFWFERFLRNCKTYHAVIKHEGDDNIKGEAQRELLKEQCYKTMTPDSPTTFNFYGVDWEHKRHRVPVKEEKDSPLPDFDQETQKFTSRKKLASVLGKLLWYRRIHRIKYHDKTIESEAITNLYSRYTPKDRVGWSEDFWITPRELKGLEEAWKKRMSLNYRAAIPLSQAAWNPDEIIWAASDAASNRHLAAGLTLTPGQKFDQSLLAAHTITRHYPSSYIIATGELFAINTTVEEILRRPSKTPPKLIVLATDSQNAKNWVEKGHAKNKDAMALLNQLDELLGECRLYLVYIPTDDNIADCPSRKDPFEKHRYSKTCELLKIATASAKGLWRIAGDRIGGVKTEQRRRQRE